MRCFECNLPTQNYDSSNVDTTPSLLGDSREVAIGNPKDGMPLVETCKAIYRFMPIEYGK